ncbi:uncharacterized protein FIESC28_10227 [Fusarium coffeatum]|uniref:Uncharacterized protein n=1 Tax=Fusarium coffeatum TaxID=231269 RepID=A0A366QU83_9HYPO|nr:uncharacterized protein FIESC28_10227 [Fusarium coffeatum]RBR08479.1 hypothetical protein FIESC28_10227 [Fusarium coffeatum]
MIITHPRIEGAIDPKVGLPYATLMEETIAQYVERVDESELVEVTIKMAISQKTIKAQSFALNALKHPPSAKPYLPEFRSQQAYRYTLRFDRRYLRRSTRALLRTFRDWGFTEEQLDHVLNIMRLYPLDGEVRFAVKEAQRQDQSQDDLEITDLVDELVTSEVIRSLYKNVFDAKEALAKSKNANRDKSLHEIALRTLAKKQNPEQYCELKKLLASVADGTKGGGPSDY